eukprot:9635015-Ditylum_brightwellii.AAC.1
MVHVNVDDGVEKESDTFHGTQSEEDPISLHDNNHSSNKTATNTVCTPPSISRSRFFSSTSLSSIVRRPFLSQQTTGTLLPPSIQKLTSLAATQPLPQSQREQEEILSLFQTPPRSHRYNRIINHEAVLSSAMKNSCTTSRLPRMSQSELLEEEEYSRSIDRGDGVLLFRKQQRQQEPSFTTKTKVVDEGEEEKESPEIMYLTAEDVIDPTTLTPYDDDKGRPAGTMDGGFNHDESKRTGKRELERDALEEEEEMNEEEFER